MKIRKIDPRQREAVFYDGTRVGERGGDGKVIDRTCPKWFPALAAEIEDGVSFTASIGDLFVRPDKTMIFYAPSGVITIEPNWWIVFEAPTQFAAGSDHWFNGIYEPVRPASASSTPEQADGGT